MINQIFLKELIVFFCIICTILSNKFPTYFFRDNPEVDVFGANLYHRYIEECLTNEKCGLPHASRQVPSGYDFTPQTATASHSVLVGTGVYDPKLGEYIALY